jgi:hypothetical protein
MYPVKPVMMFQLPASDMNINIWKTMTVMYVLPANGAPARRTAAPMRAATWCGEA